MNAASYLRTHSENQPDTVALRFPSKSYSTANPSWDSLTYGELDRWSDELAYGFRDYGLTPGEKTLVLVKPSLEFYAMLFGLLKVGAVPVLLDPGMGLKRLFRCIAQTKPTAMVALSVVQLIASIVRAPFRSVKRKITVGPRLFWGGRTLKQCRLAREESFPLAPLEAKDKMAIVFTSGSTGTPKGVMHTTAGYLLHASLTHKQVFNVQKDDIYWCTADVGWVTGHSYIVYGPLCNGITTLMFEGVPTFPDVSRFWQVIDKFKVNIFYTAPTAIRALMGLGDKPVNKCNLSSLRVLGSVGEPINPEAWKWYYEVVGKKKCPVIDTWWQTETGGILISPISGTTPLKPGSATLPFFGVTPLIVDNDGNELKGACEGNLCIKTSWPGMMRTVYRDHKRFRDTYFSSFKGKYFTGDGCKRDEDGYYWITGRVDDVINVSGHRLGTAEVESALVLHKNVSEAAVVGFPHDIKGQGIYAYVTLMTGQDYNENLKKELIAWVRSVIGPIASPDVIQWAPNLPKTRSGKIMRRILRKIACKEEESIGDTSTLNDPSVVNELVDNRGKN